MSVAGLASKEEGRETNDAFPAPTGRPVGRVSFFVLFDHLTIHERTGELP